MKKIKSLFAILLVAVIAFALTGCKKDNEDGDDDDVKKSYTYNEYLTVSPSNWNELSYQDNNDTEIMSYIGSSFFQFDYKFDNAGKIVDGEFEIQYSAATKLEDVSSAYVGEKYGIKADDTGRAYKITLRNDLKWDDGTAIDADDFVYTMKEQLNPLFQHYRADSYYIGATVIHNAENYVKQGQLTDVQSCTETSDPTSCVVKMADLVKGTNGVYTQKDGKPVYFALKTGLTYLGGDTLDSYSAYLDSTAYASLIALADEDGNVDVTDDSIGFLTTAINTADWGNEGVECLPCYLMYQKQYEELDFSEVGFFKGANEYEIILVLDKQLELMKEDGSLSYKAAYNMASLPLVKKDLYEQCKIAPSIGTDLWTSNYNTSVDTTASWGPYKLTSFQSGKQFILEKNDNWYGFNLDIFEGQYQTTKIVCETIAEWNTAWLLFQAGGLDGIGIDVSIAADYKNSEQAYFTPDDYVGSLQLQSDKEALKGRESEGINKTILSYADFRKALSLSINRSEFTSQTTTSSLAGFGIFNSMHYYDVANGGVYRNTDPAKKTLCEVYAVDPEDYDSLDEAVASITGYDLVTARALVTKAYNDALATGDIKATDKVELTFGSSEITEVLTRRFNYIKDAWRTLVVGTPLEGRLQFSQDVAKGSTWAKDFRGGSYDVCMGGWSGAAWDPGYFLLAYLSPDYMYSTAWPTDEITMEFTMPGVGANGADVTDTLTLIEWYDCLNSATDAKYSWGQGVISEDKRVLLIAALEKQVLSAYYTVPLLYSFGASLISYKLDYVTYTYNTFMGYGGIRYATYNYDDVEWEKVVSDNNNKLDYK